MREIENTDLFKLSPFKALTPDQAIAVEDILNGLFDDIASRTRSSRIVIQGDPGHRQDGRRHLPDEAASATSRHADLTEPADGDSLLSEFFVAGYPELLEGFRVGLVVPQQSLRKSIEKVFRKTPGLDPDMVLTPFEVGEAAEPFDLLIVDETHRLNQRASQASGQKNTQFRIDQRASLRPGRRRRQRSSTGSIAQSKHQVYLLDSAQRVRPHDVTEHSLNALVNAGRRRSAAAIA